MGPLGMQGLASTLRDHWRAVRFSKSSSGVLPSHDRQGSLLIVVTGHAAAGSKDRKARLCRPAHCNRIPAPRKLWTPRRSYCRPVSWTPHAPSSRTGSAVWQEPPFLGVWQAANMMAQMSPEREHGRLEPRFRGMPRGGHSHDTRISRPANPTSRRSAQQTKIFSKSHQPRIGQDGLSVRCHRLVLSPCCRCMTPRIMVRD